MYGINMILIHMLTNSFTSFRTDHFKKIKMDELLTMSRKTGFYEMIEIMIGKLKNVSN